MFADVIPVMARPELRATQMTLGQAVLQNPAAAEIFEDLNIDYFCRGDRLLDDVLEESQVSLASFHGELSQAGEHRSEPDWRIAPLRNLIKQIADKHHAYLHTELPALDKLIARLVAENPESALPLGMLHVNIRRIMRGLELHVKKEESILFPAILELEASVATGTPPSLSGLGSVANVSRVLGQEHVKITREVADIRELTNNYSHFTDTKLATPALFRRLRALALNIHKHVHLENNVLFPRAVSLEIEQSAE